MTNAVAKLFPITNLMGKGKRDYKKLNNFHRNVSEQVNMCMFHFFWPKFLL